MRPQIVVCWFYFAHLVDTIGGSPSATTQVHTFICIVCSLVAHYPGSAAPPLLSTNELSSYTVDEYIGTDRIGILWFDVCRRRRLKKSVLYQQLDFGCRTPWLDAISYISRSDFIILIFIAGNYPLGGWSGVAPFLAQPGRVWSGLVSSDNWG